MNRRPLLLLPLLLAGCGALPQPFFNRPGANGMRLSEPPTARLAIPAPPNSLLPDQAAAAWAEAVATALQGEDIPAQFGPAARTDWQLRLAAELRGSTVQPSYTVLNGAGVAQGTVDGAPVPASAWSDASAATLKAAAEGATPGIVKLLNGIEAARRQSDPESLVNRAARVYLAGVHGAPGDGNTSLANQLREKLTGLGIVVQDTENGADYKVEADVRTAPGANGTTRVELQWIVSDAKSERGRIVQINEVPPRAIQPYWGDVAAAAAAEAAGGIKQVIANASGLERKT